MTNSGAIPVPFRRNQVIPVPFRWNPVIPADSGAIPADSGAIPADSGGFRRNYRIPDGICGAPKSTAIKAMIAPLCSLVLARMKHSSIWMHDIFLAVKVAGDYMNFTCMKSHLQLHAFKFI
jgi:hypothetical protein